MKRLIAILFLFTMLLQAIPVLHFFSSRSEIFYTNIDEDKPGETKMAKEKSDLKEVCTLCLWVPAPENRPHYFVLRNAARLPSPFLESLIRPPDAAC